METILTAFTISLTPLILILISILISHRRKINEFEKFKKRIEAKELNKVRRQSKYF